MNILTQPKPPALPKHTRVVEFGEDHRPHTRLVTRTRITDNVPAYRLDRALSHLPTKVHPPHEHVVPLNGSGLLLKTILEPGT